MPKFIQLSMVVEDRYGRTDETTVPTVVDVEHIRNVHPRKGGRVGTRVVFKNGSGMPVAELYPEVVRVLTDGQITSDWVATGSVPAAEDEEMLDDDNVHRLPRTQ